MFFSLLLLLTGVRIGVDPRIELFSIVFRLAGAPEYTQGSVPSYNQAIDRHFGKFTEHEAVRMARALRESNGVAYDAVMSLALHVSDAEKLAERVALDTPGLKLDARWGGAKARPFLAAMRNFSRESNFPAFFKANAELYRETDSRLKVMVEEKADLGWFARFFGVKPEGSLAVVPGLVNGGASYGPSFRGADGVEESYAIPGVSDVDSAGTPVFVPRNFTTLIHEFLHSFANPLVDRNLKVLGASGDALYAATSEAMNAQAYTTGRIVLCESLVRAATVRYIAEHMGADAGREAANSERGRSFVWTPQVIAALGRYAENRDKYPDLAAFMPELAKVFEQSATNIGSLLQGYEDERPKVASISVRSGATDVDPATRELVIRFDRRMREGVAIAGVRGGVQPKFGKGVFDESRTSVTVPMTLEPATDYVFTLNWPGGGRFASESGALLKPVEVKFRTAAR